MAGWHQQRKRHELGQTLGDGEGQRGLACCSPWGRKESDTAGQLNSSDNVIQETCAESEIQRVLWFRGIGASDCV